ncbi:aromatic acid exporter family protein [Arthrobacter sp. zg-Y1219]|uniref:FUSC family protein n=1 Tax=Arthrobacter sp. zg-Y1219 TaxID=3049067 RepID=UPI0024C3CFAD|nr:aromatic acid exporter family protein [Arthrobacter sp. zg-Y1219]MDK1359177.1 aromatic acid exporter family protein [Arthrobacter sp. zg-Y1219]
MPTTTDNLFRKTGRLLRPSLSSVAGQVRGMLHYTRIQLAVKAALAVGIAWTLAPLVPGVAAQYPYYAPLGALVSMYPTVFGSAKAGFQTLVGLVVGMALALIALLFGGPSVWTIALIVGVGVLLAGIPKLGAGREYLPMAALFVLVMGGDDPDGYSTGYAVQMLVGVAVGLTVNAAIFPPLHLSGAVNGLKSLRLSLARQLKEMGAAISETWPPEHEAWSNRRTELIAFSKEVRESVQLAETSHRGNPRRRRHGRDLSADYEALRAMERVTLYVEDMTEVLATAIWTSPEDMPVPAELAEPLSEAMTACGEAVETWDADSEEHTQARDAVRRLQIEMNTAASPDSPVDVTASLAMSMRRILRTIRAEEEHQ